MSFDRGQGSSKAETRLSKALNSKSLKSGTDLNENSPPEDAPSTKRLKLEPFEQQSGASIVEEITRGKIELEQDKKNAEEKISKLEAEKRVLENKNTELMKSMKIFMSKNAKKNAQIRVLTEALTYYQDIFPSQLKISVVPESLDNYLSGQYKFVGLDADEFPIYKHTSSEIFLRHSFTWDAGENDMLKSFESNDPSEKMKVAKGLAKMASAWPQQVSGDDFRRNTGIWLFTDSKTGKLAWLKTSSDARNPVKLSKIKSGYGFPMGWSNWSSSKSETDPLTFEKDLKADGKWERLSATMNFEGINYKIENE